MDDDKVDVTLKALDMAERAFRQRDTIKDFAWRAAALLRFLREHDGECFIGQFPLATQMTARRHRDRCDEFISRLR